MKKPLTSEMAIMRLEALCARSEQCSNEARTRLQRWGITGGEAERIVKHLTDNRFIDDGRYARAYVHDKYMYSRWGRRKIVAGLYAKRLDRETIDEAVSEAIDMRDYAAAAFSAVAAKLRMLPEDMPQSEKRRRLLLFGAGRGYETALIIKILDSNRLWQTKGTAR